MSSKLFFHIALISSLVCIVAAMGVLYVFLGKGLFSKPKTILAARDNAVLYSDGTAEIIWNDDTPDGVMHRYTTMIPVVQNPGKQPILPMIQQTVGSWERIEFLSDDTEHQPCMRHIFYIDRVNKTSNYSSIDDCIVQTLDEHDFKYFLAMPFTDYKSIAVGTYADGKIIAKHEVPEGGITSDFHNAGMHNILPNWEVTKIAFIGNGCEGRDVATLKVYLWDVVKNTIEDRTPAGLKCENFRGLEYDHGSDTFSVELPYGKDGRQRSVVLPNETLLAPTSTPAVNQTPQKIVFDYSIILPGSHVQVVYPKEGFYGHGTNIQIMTSSTFPSFISSFQLNSTEDYDVTKGNEFVTMMITVSKNTNHTTMSDLEVGSQKLDGRYEVSGSVIGAKGQPFVIHKEAEDVTLWSAEAIDGDEIVTVTLAYKGGQGPESDLAYQENDELFREILSHVSFE